MKRFALVFIAALLLCSAACQQQPLPTPAAPKVKVVTTLFPLYDFARSIGGDKAEILLLLPPGAEAHSFEPKPSDVAHLAKADIFVYTNKYMEPWAEKMVKGASSSTLAIIDTSVGIRLAESADEHERQHEHGVKDRKDDRAEEHGHGKVDPHIWLDFRNAVKMIDAIRDGFVQKDAAHKEHYMRRADELKVRLEALDAEYAAMLATCKKKTLVSGGHFAFGYLAKRYDLKYTSAYGFSPSAEPSPRDLIRLSRLIRKQGVRYLFHEELIEPRIAETIARETGAELLLLHGAHNISRTDFDRGVTFLHLMERNFESLRKGLECR
ncbi:MAG TPA: zinc ABC transporter substrate-binding protein [Dissulfurispiraceae bacterium]|nr:zinc ABC transporter substrate-binding protein [Dissulfurispiraceae bacterium]